MCSVVPQEARRRAATIGDLVKRAYYAFGLLLIAGALVTCVPFIPTGWSEIPLANA